MFNPSLFLALIQGRKKSQLTPYLLQCQLEILQRALMPYQKQQKETLKM